MPDLSFAIPSLVFWQVITCFCPMCFRAKESNRISQRPWVLLQTIYLANRSERSRCEPRWKGLVNDETSIRRLSNQYGSLRYSIYWMHRPFLWRVHWAIQLWALHTWKAQGSRLLWFAIFRLFGRVPANGILVSTKVVGCSCDATAPHARSKI